MSSIMRLRLVTLTAIASIGLAAVAATAAHAATEPTKFVPSLRFGENVNKTTHANVCLVSETSCGTGEESNEPGGFVDPATVAVAKDGNVYEADNNRRIQEFTAAGEFVLMFGWNVNKTMVKQREAQEAKSEPVTVTQAQENVCTAAEVEAGAECLEGEKGTGEGTENAGAMFNETTYVAVDQATGDVYVFDPIYGRVDEFTEDGEFILTIGGSVNKTNAGKAGASEAEKDVCTEVSKDVCGPGVEGAGHGAFESSRARHDVLAIGGPENLLYVGIGTRVQEFHTEAGSTEGEWASEISLTALSSTGSASAIAVDTAGDVFVAEEGVLGVHEYNAKEELQPLVIDPEGNKEIEENGKRSAIMGIAFDHYGRIGIVEERSQYGFPNDTFANIVLLYKTSGELVGEVALPPEAAGIPYGVAFDASSASDQMYVAEGNAHVFEEYVPVVFPDVRSCPASEVLAVTVTLCGEINPNGVLAKGFFEYGVAGHTQTVTPVAFEKEGIALESYDAQVAGLIPNQTYQFRAVVEALAEGAEKQATGEVEEFHTATPPPEIVGEPSASFIGAQSAVLEASLNPEHANTTYHFEYMPCNGAGECGSPLSTPAEQSAQYGTVGFAQEVTGLAPSSSYRYRLVANNEHEEAGVQQGGEAAGSEGSFTTAAAPSVGAATGGASAVTSTSAVVSGSVDPDGQPARYAFELGVYDGAGTQYDVVFSGPAGEGTVAVGESLAVTGLQPGTTYAYRIKVASGYGTQTGVTVLFTTLGLPEVLLSPVSLPMLAVPNVAFPAPVVSPATKTVTKKKAKKKSKGAKKKSKHKQPKKAHKTSAHTHKTHKAKQ